LTDITAADIARNAGTVLVAGSTFAALLAAGIRASFKQWILWLGRLLACGGEHTIKRVYFDQTRR
jgi:hypothetical protein